MFNRNVSTIYPSTGLFVMSVLQTCLLPRAMQRSASLLDQFCFFLCACVSASTLGKYFSTTVEKLVKNCTKYSWIFRNFVVFRHVRDIQKAAFIVGSSVSQSRVMIIHKARTFACHQFGLSKHQRRQVALRIGARQRLKTAVHKFEFKCAFKVGVPCCFPIAEIQMERKKCRLDRSKLPTHWINS